MINIALTIVGVRVKNVDTNIPRTKRRNSELRVRDFLRDD